jgi:hypothetical protein
VLKELWCSNAHIKSGPKIFYPTVSGYFAFPPSHLLFSSATFFRFAPLHRFACICLHVPAGSCVTAPTFLQPRYRRPRQQANRIFTAQETLQFIFVHKLKDRKTETDKQNLIVSVAEINIQELTFTSSIINIQELFHSHN